jgi:hypothetical protein
MLSLDRLFQLIQGQPDANAPYISVSYSKREFPEAFYISMGNGVLFHDGVFDLSFDFAPA